MKYNGIDPTTLHRGISVAKEIPPGAPTSQLETLTGTTGEIIAGRTLKQAEYIVRINIAGKTRAEAWEIRAILANWACATDTETHRLQPTHWPTVAYDAILKEISPPEFTFGFAVVDVIFTIPRPIAKGEMKRMSSGSGSATLSVLGSHYIHPEFTVNMKSASRAEIAVDGKVYMAVNYPFAEGDVLRVETELPVVEITSGGNIIAAERYVDYTVTDFEEMCKAITPGIRHMSCGQASRLNVLWREEFL